MITATPDGHRVLLTVYAPATLATLVRSDANGNQPVRTRAGTYAGVTDEEAALDGLVTYSSGDFVARLNLGLARPWIVFPFRPGTGLELEQVTDYGAARTSLGTVYQVPGRPDPLAVLGGLTTRTGTMDIYCADAATARTREAALAKGTFGMLKTPDQSGMDMYFITTGTTVRPDNGAWMLGLDYMEVPRPSGNLSEWTVGALRAAFPTIEAMAAAFGTVAALANNERLEA